MHIAISIAYSYAGPEEKCLGCDKQSVLKLRQSKTINILFRARNIVAKTIRPSQTANSLFRVRNIVANRIILMANIILLRLPI